MLFLLRVGSITALHVLYFRIFPFIALPPLSSLVFRVWKDLTGCTLAMRSSFVLSGGRRFFAELGTHNPLR